MREDERRARSFAKELRSRMTDAEIILWSRLRRWPDPRYKFRRQHPIGIYIADFACIASRLVVEVDGATHSTQEERAHDLARERYLTARGWRTIRIPNQDIYERLNDIVSFIAGMFPPPPRAP